MYKYLDLENFEYYYLLLQETSNNLQNKLKKIDSKMDLIFAECF